MTLLPSDIKAPIVRERGKICLVKTKEEECSRIIRNCIHSFRYKQRLISQICSYLYESEIVCLRETAHKDFNK